MATLRRWVYWELVGGVKPASGGSLANPVETTVDGLIDGPDAIQLATATSLTVWNSAEALTTFDFFYLQSDQALKIEITCDRGGEVGSEEFVFVHPANTPFILNDDTALANYSGTLSGGTSDVIDEIVIRNESGTTANIVRAVIT